ncbi:DNA polymerase III subunit gamma/tau [Chelatococcus reniformis]|uniref:DNA polymerase III subunit gamma/tau n=1 Tax=Chelatococcus reniformis TaxID=1494448 RepID=A0A916UMW5_9HYPH|nr:DNA polymerase III subunit gamma/tau [Chelatococcus reniformis]
MGGGPAEALQGAAGVDEPGLPGFAPPPTPPQPAQTAPGYRVLARKYRPRTFDDLIGQEAMVRTLSNAFATGRIPQAWMLTGVRGVGKTTTARILARGLNYELPGDRGAGPTIRMPELGVHCREIIDGNHIDVLEIDAASNNGVDNIRQINDAVRYAPVSARYKVYIVDEVHMLTTGAFNAFLKTLEEPPPHAKFIFATTEIRKVPVTILSRCQRFDLRRVGADVLVAHLAAICRQEEVTADDGALALIARAAEGSVRDSLSLLDQAIAHGAGDVSAETVRAMLGLADRGRIIDLFEAVMRGDLPAALAELADQYEAGADPAVVLAELASFTHLVTRLKLVPGAAKDGSLTDVERGRGTALGEKLSLRMLSRTWQMLLKGVPEVQEAPRPMAAAEMVLVRLAYAADLPTPDEALRLLRSAGPPGSAGAGAGTASSAPMPTSGREPPRPGLAAVAVAGAVRAVAEARADQPQAQALAPQVAPPEQMIRVARFEDLVALAGEKREIGFKLALERDVRLVRFEDGQIEFALADGASRSLAADISRYLQDWTGRRWMVAVSSGPGEPTLAERARAADHERRSDAAAHPLVRAVLERFPGAQIVNVREAPTAPDAADDIIGDTIDEPDTASEGD